MLFMIRIAFQNVYFASADADSHPNVLQQSLVAKTHV